MKSPLPYIGGKSRIAKQLIDKFPPHRLFVELFGGGGNITLAKEPSEFEVYNDLDNGVANFFRVCQFHPEELVRSLRFAIVSRSWFELFKKTDPSTLTDIQKAARTFYLHKNSFGGRVISQTYHYFRNSKSNFNPLTLKKQIEDVHRRLARVQIECLPYQDVLQKFDTPNTFFFADPPYFKKPYYRHNFTLEDYIELARQLGSLKGKFLMTLNDKPEMREVFAKFQISTIEFAYTCLQQNGRRFVELIIKNY